jgi:hypothetical protein
MTTDPIRALAILIVILVTTACATFGDAPTAPPPGVFSAEAALPPAGTRWGVRMTMHNENTRTSETQTLTWLVLGDGTQAGRPVAVLWDGANLHVHDRATGGWIALLDADARELISYEPHEGQLSSPLWVGKSWVARSTWRSKIHGRLIYDVVVVWKVVAYEEVQVPAGRFKAFRLVAWPDERGQVRKRTDWYAPDIRLVVKSVTEGFGAPYSVGVGKDRVTHVIELTEHANPSDAIAAADHAYARRAAARALVSLGAGAPDTVARLMDTPKEADPPARPSSAADLNEALKGIADDVRGQAVSALSAPAARAPEAVATLIEIVRSPETRLSTIWMLASLSGSAHDAIPVLREILRLDSDEKVRRAVTDAIERLAETVASPTK